MQSIQKQFSESAKQEKKISEKSFIDVKQRHEGISYLKHQGRTQDFLKGGPNFFPCLGASRVRKINFT